MAPSTMKKTRNEVMEEAYETIRKQVIDEVLNTIVSKKHAIRTLLDNGMPLLGTVNGKRYGKLWNKRQMLWNKVYTLNEVWEMVFYMRNKNAKTR